MAGLATAGGKSSLLHAFERLFFRCAETGLLDRGRRSVGLGGKRWWRWRGGNGRWCARPRLLMRGEEVEDAELLGSALAGRVDSGSALVLLALLTLVAGFTVPLRLTETWVHGMYLVW